MAEPFDPDPVADGDGTIAPRRPSRRRRLLSIVVLVAIALSVGNGSFEHWRTEYAKWRNDADAYAFLHLQADGSTPVTYSSCHPIEVVVNARTMPRPSAPATSCRAAVTEDLGHGVLRGACRSRSRRVT